MTIKQVTKWETDDGRLFDSEESARQHIENKAKLDSIVKFLCYYEFDDGCMTCNEMAIILNDFWNMEKK